MNFLNSNIYLYFMEIIVNNFVSFDYFRYLIFINNFIIAIELPIHLHSSLIAILYNVNFPYPSKVVIV
jgi:hypothetical protein